MKSCCDCWVRGHCWRETASQCHTALPWCFKPRLEQKKTFFVLKHTAALRMHLFVYYCTHLLQWINLHAAYDTGKQVDQYYPTKFRVVHFHMCRYVLTCDCTEGKYLSFSGCAALWALFSALSAGRPGWLLALSCAEPQRDGGTAKHRGWNAENSGLLGNWMGGEHASQRQGYVKTRQRCGSPKMKTSSN